MAQTPEYTSERIVLRSHIDKQLATGALVRDVTVGVCLKDFDFIDKECVKTEGVALHELGQTDSRRAYKITKLVLSHLISKGVESTYYQNQLVASKYDATADELQTINKTSVESVLPDEDITGFDFHLGVYPTKEDVEIFDADPNTIMPIVDMRLDPPQLAC